MGKVGWIVVAMVALIVLCIGAAMIDSCKRNNRACFGSSQNK